MQMDTGFPTPLNYLNAQQVTIAKKQGQTNHSTHTHWGKDNGQKKSAHRKKEKKTLSRLSRNNRTPDLSN